MTQKVPLVLHFLALFFCLYIMSAYYIYHITTKWNFYFWLQFCVIRIVSYRGHTQYRLYFTLLISFCISCLNITVIADLPYYLSLHMPYQNTLPLVSLHTAILIQRSFVHHSLCHAFIESNTCRCRYHTCWLFMLYHHLVYTIFFDLPTDMPTEQHAVTLVTTRDIPFRCERTSLDRCITPPAITTVHKHSTHYFYTHHDNQHIFFTNWSILTNSLCRNTFLLYPSQQNPHNLKSIYLHTQITWQDLTHPKTPENIQGHNAFS